MAGIVFFFFPLAAFITAWQWKQLNKNSLNEMEKKNLS
jgi:hypothetical protein